MTRDLNLVVDEAVRWADVAATVRSNGGPCFESLEYRDTYRDPERLGATRRACCLRSPCARPKARSPASRPTRSATGSWPPAGQSTGRN